MKITRKNLKIFVWMMVMCVCIFLYADESRAASKPSKVKGIEINKTTNSTAVLSYDKVAGVSGYEIEVYTADGREIVNSPTKYTTKKLKELKSATVYKVRVRAYKWTSNGKKIRGDYSKYVFFGTKPETVTGLSANNYTNTSVTIKWNKVPRVTGYYIYVRENGKGDWKFVRGSSNPQYVATNMKAGVTYEYLIKPFYKYNGEKITGASSRIQVVAEPAKVANLEATSKGLDNMTITWDKSAGATAYDVYVYENNKLIKQYTTKYTSRKLTELKAEAKYKITVKPHKFCTKTKKIYGKGTTITAYTKPERVKSVKITEVGTDYVNIGFAPVDNVDDYLVSVATKSNPGKVVTYVTTDTKYTITSLKSDENYVITVKARKKINNKLRISETATEKTAYVLPEAIKDIEYLKHSEDGFALMWKGNDNAKRYDIYYKKDGDLSYSKAGGTPDAEYVITGLDSGTKYWAYVVTVITVDKKTYKIIGDEFYTYTAPEQVKLNGGYTKEGVYEIGWTDTSGRTAFELRKYNDETGKWDALDSTVETNYTYKVTDSTDSCRFKVRPYIKTEDGEYIWGEFSDNVEINAGRWGIDVSKHQGKIDWEKVAKSGVQFAIIRVGYRGYSYGTIVEDPYFEENIKGALANGIDVGIYFFSTAISEKEAIEEAEWTLNRIRGYNVTYPIVFDYEGYENPDYRSYGQTRTNRSNYAIAFLDYVRSKGYIPMMYASQYYYNTQWDTDRLSDYNLWVAKYPSGNNGQLMVGSEPKINYPYAMWQYSSTGKVDGIQAANGDYRNVDMNYQYTSFKK